MLRVGVIGCGSIAKQRHGYEYFHNANVEIKGFYDLIPERAQTLVDLYGGKVYADVDALLSDPDIDAVSVCMANAFHAEISIKALRAGKHVLCEKPMAVSLEECEAMVAAARESGKRLMIGHNQRLAPAHKKAKELLTSGALGRVITFQSTFGHKGPEMWSMDKSANTWFFKKASASFGSMADLGIHKIDLMRYLIGSEITSVYSSMKVLDKKFPDGTPIEVDDNSVEVLTFANGALGVIDNSRQAVYGYDQRVEAFGSKGMASDANDLLNTTTVLTKDGAHSEKPLWFFLERYNQAFINQVISFVDAINNDTQTAVGAIDGLRPVLMAKAATESCQAGGVFVKVSE